MREIMQGYLCAGTLTHLEDNRSVATVKCPLDGSIYSRSAFAGQLCKTCEICTLGQDAMGLSIKLEGGPQPETQNSQATASSMSGAADPMASALESAAGSDLFL